MKETDKELLAKIREVQEKIMNTRTFGTRAEQRAVFLEYRKLRREFWRRELWKNL
jgi:hypothetical protein